MKNAIVGQSGGPTAAINATLAGVILGAQKANAEGKIGKLLGMRNGVQGLLEENIIDLSGFFSNSDKIEMLCDTPAAALGSCRKKLPQDICDPLYDTLFQILEKNNVGAFFYIGGNDSMDSVAKLTKAAEQRNSDIAFIGVPKTIDNDLCCTDHTPGFGSAAKFIAVTVAEILLDCAVYTTPAVTVVEMMGRDAGWLTAAASLGRLCGKSEPDLVYLPEVAFSEKEFLEDVRSCLALHPNVVVAVSEGVRRADGSYIAADPALAKKDGFGHVQLSGAGKALENLVKREIGCKVRSIELNLPQRCAAHIASATDIAESKQIGSAAVDAFLQGVKGKMMSFDREQGSVYSVSVSAKEIALAANAVRSVPRHFINQKGNGVTDECLSYIAPLILGERTPKYENGLPCHVIL